ncbi:MAG: hypothetical protein WAO46_05680, partial [Tepidanaerobacteraceae bacterium]
VLTATRSCLGPAKTRDTDDNIKKSRKTLNMICMAFFFMISLPPDWLTESAHKNMKSKETAEL